MKTTLVLHFKAYSLVESARRVAINNFQRHRCATNISARFFCPIKLQREHAKQPENRKTKSNPRLSRHGHAQQVGACSQRTHAQWSKMYQLSSNAATSHLARDNYPIDVPLAWSKWRCHARRQFVVAWKAWQCQLAEPNHRSRSIKAACIVQPPLDGDPTDSEFGVRVVGVRFQQRRFDAVRTIGAAEAAGFASEAVIHERHEPWHAVASERLDLHPGLRVRRAFATHQGPRIDHAQGEGPRSENQRPSGC